MSNTETEDRAEQLLAERRRLARRLVDGDKRADAQLRQVELQIAELQRDLDLQNLAEEQRRLDEERAKREKAAELKLQREHQMRQLARRRMQLNRGIEQSFDKLFETCEQHLETGKEMWALAQSLGGEGRYYDSRNSLINYLMFRLTPLFPSDLTLPYESAQRPLTEIESGKLGDWLDEADS